jgi:hypothetical protein
MGTKSRWIMVALYPAGMAWVESAAVFYLRTLVDRVDPYQPHSVTVRHDLISVELVREAATLLMLFAVAWLAGQTKRSRFGYFLIAFGIWDILYYVFMGVISGWPRSILDWDMLFLLPLPWWRSVLAPLSLATLMILAGILLCQAEHTEPTLWPRRWAWGMNLIGVVLLLYVFMADAIGVLAEGMEAVRTVRPVWFNWPLFLMALLALAAPFIDLVSQLWRHHSRATRVQEQG